MRQGELCLLRGVWAAQVEGSIGQP